MQLIEGEIEMGVFKKLQVSTTSGSDQEQMGRSQA